MSAGSESTILSTVEKAELMSAIGREIERVDRQAATSGYTSWALWAAIGILSWKVIELLGPKVTLEVGVMYLLLMTTIATLGWSVRYLFREQTGSFRTFNLGKAGLANMLLAVLISIICITIQILRPISTVAEFWIPTVFASLPIIAAIGSFLVPKIPLAEGFPKKGPGRYGTPAAFALLVGMGVLSIAILLPSVDMSHLAQPTTSVKVALLLAAITVLALQLSRNMHIGERRTQFQRLETELTLSKVDVGEAKERYENLMLGMNVSAAIRPWVEAVMHPLEEANASLSEVKQLLVRFNQARSTENADEDSSLDVAVAERVSSLLDKAKQQYLVSGKAYSKLKNVSYMISGERDISKSLISSENEHIHESRRKFEVTFKEVSKLASSIEVRSSRSLGKRSAPGSFS